ncbi:hypothetical protein ABZ896_29105 [Streptomyces sp. NPDC047072]|uniref:hypothetical protein n=1 Tax=Streptomyces sp. NPDC047072 TaxID=3154809 RepID=UPI0033F5119B
MDVVEDRKPARTRAALPGRVARFVIAAGLLALSWFLTGPLVDEYQLEQRYLKAVVCPSGPDCLVPGTGLVKDRRHGESCSTDSYGAKSCAPYYQVLTEVRVRDDRRTVWLSVAADTYREIAVGDRLGLSVWQDRTVRIEVGDRTERLDPFFSLFNQVWWLQGSWVALGLAVVVASGHFRGLVLSGTGPFLLMGHYFLGAGAALAVEHELFPLGVAGHGWKALWVGPVVFGGFGVLWTALVVVAYLEDRRERARP